MINRKCKCAQQRTGFRESCTAEALCQKSAEERFLKKGIDQRDVRKNEQTILFRELFLLHEILPDCRQIEKAAEQQKSQQNRRNHGYHKDNELSGFLHRIEADALFEPDAGHCSSDAGERTGQEQLDETFEQIGRCEQLFRQHHAGKKEQRRECGNDQLFPVHAASPFQDAIASATNSRALRSAATTSS